MIKEFHRLLVLLVLLPLVHCTQKKYGGRSVPAVIRKQISIYQKSASCKDAHVDEMIFQAARVFLFDPGKCGADMTADVYDEKGKLLGSLGGIRGNMIINGEDFDHAKKQRTIWTKESP
jgi:hypothetical protein